MKRLKKEKRRPGAISKKRTVALYIVVVLMLGAITARLYALAQGGTAFVADTHGSYTVNLGTQRGDIYDTNMKSLVNESNIYMAAVMPSKDIAAELAALMPHVYDTQTVLTRMQQGKPFATRVDTPDIDVDGVKVVTLKQRYADAQLAPHIIGYLDSGGSGVSGIEKAYDNVLKKDGGDVTADFAIDAMGRTLQGVACEVHTPGTGSGGVQLTLDSDIQKDTQQAAAAHLKSGAAIVMDAKTGDILASASVPTFSENTLADSLKGQDSPLLNRAFSAYDVGSVFKIALAAEALDSGVDPNMTVDCTGKINVDGQIFRCEKLDGHGVLNMEGALMDSCNIYFITLGQLLGGDKILSMAQKLGFGQASAFAPGYAPAAGVLPTAESLKIPAALANFSFGQGNFMATPVQVARMMCAVANDGLLPQARLVKATIGSDGKTAELASPAPQRVISSATAAMLRSDLIQTVEAGTGTPAKPEVGGAGGKTSTAQTGWVKDGKVINQAWFAGFYPAVDPKYVIVVVSEAGNAGGSSAGPVFKEIADDLAPYCGYSLPVAENGAK